MLIWPELAQNLLPFGSGSVVFRSMIDVEAWMGGWGRRIVVRFV